MGKTPSQIDREIAEILAGATRAGKKRKTSHGKLVVLDDANDGQACGIATPARIREFVERGTVDGSPDKEIGIAYREHFDDEEDDEYNEVAVGLSREEARAFL